MTDSPSIDNGKSLLESEFEEFESQNTWNLIFQRLRNESASEAFSVSNTAARLPQNRNKNRYRDILPYDHTRIVLQGDADYVNASLVEVPEADRRYILTQGPLSNTLGDFWTMCWQQDSRGVVMLSRLFEKDTAKCHPYFPGGDEPGEILHLPDADLRVTMTKYEDFVYYLVRTLSLERVSTGEKREVLQFQYLTWPDFGCPHSPASFLNFLLAIRRARLLSSDCGPCVVHCSAGVGRSGSFCMVDSALRIIERTRTLSTINVRKMLTAMRRSRVGLIQSCDQLRFTYQAIIEGGRALLRLDASVDPDAALNFETSESDANVPASASASSSEPAEHVSLPSSSASSSTKSLDQVANEPPQPRLRDSHTHAEKRRSNEDESTEYVSSCKRPRRPRALNVERPQANCGSQTRSHTHL